MTEKEMVQPYHERIRLLMSLLEDPHPGLMTWCEMFAVGMDNLVEFWEVDRKKSWTGKELA